MQRKLTDQIRAAVDASGMTRYRICKAIGLNQGTLSRFMRGGGLSLDTLDKLAGFLGIEAVIKRRKRQGD
jgi:transcriptional regulator with XRE-family HTH domain